VDDVLLSLRLESFVIVAEAELSFGSGLNAVTGETGTGKSILIDAIGFLAGERADADWVREGASGLMVEGVFAVDRLPAAVAAAIRLECPPSDGRILLRREMTRAGKSKAWIQGRSVRLTDLREVGEQCLAIHGQGEHRRLLDPVAQIELADRFAGAGSLRDAYGAVRARWLRTEQECATAEKRLAELVDKEDWHRFQVEEIDATGPVPGEEAALRDKRAGAAAGRKATQARAELGALLFEEEGSVGDRLESALHRLGGLGEGWRGFRDEIVAAREALRRARHLLPSIEEEEVDLDRIEERLSLLTRMKKKYGATEEAILERRSALAALLEETDRLRSRIGALAMDRDDARKGAADAGLRLREARQGIAPSLARTVSAELHELGMSGAALDLILEEEPLEGNGSLPVGGHGVRAFADGIDKGWFRLRPNPGEGAGPLASVASGGELSRSLLAILAVLGGREEPRTAIFDEVDAGVGGATAVAVARRLELLARDRQVLLVTHLPLIACRAARHFRVEKRERAGRTTARVTALDRDGRIGELARMLAGEGDSAIARKHAEALIREAGVGEGRS
jgi:DNA repair protein RecN (Recombination protein N)